MRKKHIMTKGIKKLLSIGLAAAMLIGVVPESFLQYTPFEAVHVFAADFVKYDIADYDKVDPVTNYIRISTWKELCDYSQAYFEATNGTYGENITHKNDTLLMAITDANSINLDEEGFEPIGNQKEPFEGKLLFETSSLDTFDLNKPIFGYIKDCVKIVERSDESVSHQLKIRRIGDASGEPLFAYKVLDDGDPESTADWAFEFLTYEEGSDIKYAGAIGEIGADADVRLTMINNAEQGRSPVETNATGNSSGEDEEAEDPRPVDVGAVCGKISSNASLSLNYSGSNYDFTVESINGNAGGLVGSMETGSKLTILTDTVNLQGSDALISAGNGYAGGIVGKNDGGTIEVLTTEPYPVKQQIFGGNGSGGICGYYHVGSADTEFDVSKCDIACKVMMTNAGEGYAGGLFGMMENDNVAFAVKGAEDSRTVISSSHVAGASGGEKAKGYGGLIGSYQASSTTLALTVKDLKVNADNALGAALYGGSIANVIEGSYVKVSDFNLQSAQSSGKATTFGGIVASTDYGYIYVENAAFGDAGHKITGFAGGGVIGELGNGVLGLAGGLDLSYIAPTANAENGQIVAKRDNALVYAENGFQFTPNSIELDNVGSWGDVLSFGDNLNKSDVFSETDHIITIGDVATDDIKSAEDFARISLLYQIDVSKNMFLADAPNSLGTDVNLQFTDTVDLTGTGLRGLTRDNGDKRITYNGDITGTTGKSIILDIRNIGGTDRPVYRHQYNGLIAKADGITIRDLSLGGKLLLKNNRGSKEDDALQHMYSGSAMATAVGDIQVMDCNTMPDLNMIEMNNNHYSGRLLGDALSGIGTINVTGGTYDGSITGGSVNSRAGGVIGYISRPAAQVDWTFDNITLKGTVSGTRIIGGLIAEAHGDNKAHIALIGSESGTGIVADGIIIEGNSSESMGGLLGYAWYNADVDVTKVSVSGTPVVRQNGSGGLAGLVYLATGHWIISDLALGYTDSSAVLHTVKMEAGSADSVGMIVNKGIDGKNGIYLEILEDSYRLALNADSTFKEGAVYDEICAYSAPSAADMMKNGQGVISIAGTDYKNQTAQGAVANDNARYYYNVGSEYAALDANAPAPKKLMAWGLNQYAASNIKKHFKDLFENTIPDGDYDMEGYSWYPVTLEKAMTVNGSFTFYNQECKNAEDGKASDNKWSPLEKTQHYMMQNGLFYDASKSLTIKNITLKGTVGAIDDASGTGALIYGTISGRSNSDKTTVDSSKGSITLDGIRIWNLSDYGSYAPLLINKASDYVSFNINGVSTTNAYIQNGATISAATSLLGKAGTRTTATESTTISQGISVDFTNIKLDGRARENNGVYDSDRYNTTKSIFTEATLLEWLVGSYGTYNYDYESDWGDGTPHRVTYGKEVGYTTQGQYPNEELWYEKEKVSGGKGRYVHPDSAQPDSGSVIYDGFDAFLPYVRDVSEKDAIDAKTAFKFQLMVNHQPAEKIEGCGSYNDPYIIKSANDLVNLSKWLQSDSDFNSDKIDVDLDQDMWCDAKVDGENVTLKAEHVTFTCTSGGCTAGNVSWTTEKMRKYLAGAYYKIELSGSTSIELTSDSGFLGLGIKDDGFRFHGVIEGNNTTLINKTQYPLINFSSGSVVRNLPIQVDATITLADATESEDYITTNKGPLAYGAVISVVAGGDNILDNVQVTFGESVIATKGLKAQYQAVGGFVGVIVDGDVIFRNMPDGAAGLSDANVTAQKGAKYPSIDGVNNAAKLNTAAQNMTKGDNLLWLYVNPFIGRVIHGFAVTESDSYKPRHEDCTLDNGNKNYSITDISDQLDNLSIEGSTVTVPNGQAFFLMSVIVNSGMGANGSLGYSNSFAKRTAAYDQIGSDAATPEGCSDYFNAAKTDGTSKAAYIISKYAVDAAKALGSGTDWVVRLSENGDYHLPDGYRGIGSFYHNDNNYLLNVKEFDGKNNTIFQNSYFYYYTREQNDFDKIYYPFSGITGAPSNSSATDAGFGLFNRQVQGSAKYKNMILSGTIKCDAINNKTGQHIPYTDGTGSVTKNWSNQKTVLSCGALFGNFSGTGNTTIENVALRDMSVFSSKMAGGLVGIVPVASDVNLTIQITDGGPDSYGIEVHGGLSAGGLIARYQQGKCMIDFNGHKFALNGVYSDTIANTDSYYYGVGGIIGTLRAGLGSPAPAVTIQNVTIGDANANEPIIVGCTQENCGINVGGLIGTINRASPTMINAHVYNVTVVSGGNNTHVGGAFGHCRTESRVTVRNSSIISNIEDETKKAYIYGNGHVGGFLGNSPDTSDGTLDFKVENSSIEGYTISGKIAGGLVGERSAKDTSRRLTVNNFLIKDCVIKGDTYAGGLVGYLKNPMNGYNIMTVNLSFEPHTVGGTIGKLGYLVGQNDSVIKIVGFSRNESLEVGESSNMIQPMTGGNSDYNYGTDGYVIFADYLGADINRVMTGDVDVATGLTTSTEEAPYVNLNPKTELDAGDTPKFVTGDGAHRATIDKILNDISSAELGYYATAASVAGEFDGKIGSFKTEMGTKTLNIGGRDFPVLIIDDINKANTTNRINHYIALLTNTDPNAYNYAAYGSNNKIFRTVIHKCTYDSTGTVLTIKNGDADEINGVSSANNAIPCLKRNSSQFYMNANDTDTASTDAQFTLIDVQYLDPSNDKQIVYHLYVPVYVKKVVEYDFNIHVESGTNYKVNPPVFLKGNTLIENIGVPVTFEFTYTYNRTPEEWIAAVNGGDSLLTNYPKSLIFTNASKLVNGSMPELPSDTRMVLIDTQNSSRAYYLDALSATSFAGTGNEKKLILSSFVSGNNQFTPVDFNDMMIVTVEKSTTGTLVLNSAHPSNTYSPIVTDNSGGAFDGMVFRYSSSDESGIASEDRYTVKTITFANGEESLTEHYFLSVYSNFSENTPVFHYVVSSGKDLGTNPYPSRISKASENNVSNLFMGYIYDQKVYLDKLAVNGDEELYCINSDNRQLDANVRATIRLTASAESNGIKTYLGNTNPPSIYESLMLQFDKYTQTESVVGIAGVSDVEITSYTINGATAARQSSVTTASYIELRNNESLARYLKEGTVVIEAAVSVTFDADNGGIQDQFYPQSPDTRGTKVIALSKIASNSSQTAYSKTSVSTDKLWDSVNGVEGRTNRYYTDDKEEATLTFDPMEIYEEGQTPQLGINGNDPLDVVKLPAQIKALGTYNMEKCQRAFSDAKYVKIEIELRSIEDNYTTALKFFDYIDETSFSVLGGIAGETNQTTDTKLVYLYEKSALSSYYMDKVYQIPIDFRVFSSTKFEGDQLRYANYAVFLNVYLLDADRNIISSSVPARADYVKFTNAKIYLNRVDPDK